jgi:hypothetical protein
MAHSPERARGQASAARSDSAGRLDTRLYIACGLAWGAAVIHIEATIEHADEYVLYAVFFALLAPAQFAWGLLACRRPRPRLLAIGAIGCLLVVAVWVMSRTTGMPIGPDGAWTPEPIGAIDAIATGDELLIAVLVGSYLWLPPGRLAERVSRATVAIGLALITLNSLALMIAGHEH